MQSKVLKPELTITSTDTAVSDICKKYWSFGGDSILDDVYTFPVSTIASEYKKKDLEITNIAREHCTAVFRCNRCREAIPVKIRSQLENHRKNIHKLIFCEKHKYSKPNNEVVSIKPVTRLLIGLSDNKQEYFQELIKIYDHVFPNISPSVFVSLKAIEHLFDERKENWNKWYFLTTRFHFVVCDKKYNPLFVVDVAGDKTKDEVNNFKRTMLEEVQLPYYLLPDDEAKVISNPFLISER